jgi:DNA polymerase/3'-5' exonuclease PolX
LEPGISQKSLILVAEIFPVDNPTMARLLAETADLMEIDGADSFRIRSYRRAAEAVEQTTVDLMAVASDTPRLLEIPGIGKSMATNLQAIAATGSLPQRDELVAKYGTGILELLKLPGMGPKTIALFWAAAKITSIDQLAEAIEAGHLAKLPRMGAKQIEKLKKGIEDYRRSAGRFRIDEAEDAATRISTYLLAFDGIERVTPAGSLRRGRETEGDLDLPTGTRRGSRRVCRSISGHPQHDRQGRKQGELLSEQQPAGGCATSAFGIVRGRAAILHRLQGTQRLSSPART